MHSFILSRPDLNWYNPLPKNGVFPIKLQLNKILVRSCALRRPSSKDEGQRSCALRCPSSKDEGQCAALPKTGIEPIFKSYKESVLTY